MELASVDEIVAKHVRDVEAIDVHTHLLPPTHGALLLYGIDELLTYHYLVAELFMVLPIASEEDSAAVGVPLPSADEFHAWPKDRQAELVFEKLFVEQTPLSEACRGVVTVLNELGLGGSLKEAKLTSKQPRLTKLREWFAKQDPAAYLERVFQHAKLRYAVMTNIPFAAEEAVHWISPSDRARAAGLTPRLRTALRIDPVLCGDWPTVSAALKRSSPPYEASLDGCRAYLVDWVRRIRPIYLMASTPPAFRYVPTRRARKRNADGEQSVGLPAEHSVDAGRPSATELLEQVLLRVAAEERLPIALKVGAVRGVNPALRAGGDGVEVADLTFLRTLCAAYPSIKFLVTVLSVDNQHELCVLARKFGNLHVYGCWWFCNNPCEGAPAASSSRPALFPASRLLHPSARTVPSSSSTANRSDLLGGALRIAAIIEATTRMRLEMLGSAFTCQHSDARVLDQLLYKWPHSRAAVSPVLASQYRRLIEAGWEVSEDDVRRDVELLFGGAFEAFLAK